MRMVVGLIAVTLAGCGTSEEKRDAADANAAGFVPPSVTSRLDWGSQQERRFKRLDRNADGSLSPDELPRPDSRIASYDKDGSGEVGLTEYTDGVMARFDATDLNRDGTVTSEEQRSARKQR
jgi:hypothetical protein